MIVHRYWIKFIRFISVYLFISVGPLVPQPPVHAAVPAIGSLSVVSPCTETNLRAAVTAGGTVTFNCGGPVIITVASPIIISTHVSIDGGGSVTVSGNSSTGVFSSNNNLTVTLKNLSIINGHSSDQGAGLKVGFWNTLNIENVTFTGNVSLRDANACDGGGAIFIGGGSTATISASTFTNNQAQNGGAINSLRTDLTLRDSTFSNNQALHSPAMDSRGDCGGGGAVYIDGANSFNKASTSLVERSTFTNNRTNNHGGAIFIGLYSNETLTLNNLYLSNNRAEKNTQGNAGTGGGVWFGRGNPGQPINPLIVQNTTFASNHADTQGGGLWVDASAQLTNVTFSGNDAINPASLPADDWRRGNGGGIAENLLSGEAPLTLTNVTFANNNAGFNGGAIAGDALILRNTLFANNTGGNPWAIQQHCTNALTHQGGSYQFPNRNPNPNYWNETNCAGNITIADPKLGALTDNGGYAPTRALLAGSPALNTANAAYCPATDQRGAVRSLGGACDAGAYEVITKLAISPLVVAVTDPAFMLVVQGDGFNGTSQIEWDGAPLTTEFVNRFTVRATVSPTTFSTPGNYPITVSGSALTSATVQVWPTAERLYLPVVRR